MPAKKQILNVGVLDYGLGNLHSVSKSLEAAGAKPIISSSSSILAKQDVLVLPGQGAFQSAMAHLRQQKMVSFVQDWIKKDLPYLGICLGLQLLFEGSDEAPGVKGLGVLTGRVKKIPRKRGLKIPHMGWNQATPTASTGLLSHLLDPKAYYYFVHSYYVSPKRRTLERAVTSYGKDFCTAVAFNNAVATQCHPEKSGKAGQLFLRKVLSHFQKIRKAR